MQARSECTLGGPRSTEDHRGSLAERSAAYPCVSSLVGRAREVQASVKALSLRKAIWASPMGKTPLAPRIVAEIPEHRIYVEPFVGSGAVLLGKAPSEVEVVSDLDPEIAFAFRFATSVTEDQIERLRSMPWTGDREHFKRLEASAPSDDPVERFYRFAYLTRFSFNKLRRGAMPHRNVGVRSHLVRRLERHRERLSRVQVRHADYAEVVQEFDGPQTFFFLDPPYAGYDADARGCRGAPDWDEARFRDVLKSIRGRFLCTYGIRGRDDLFEGFHVRRWSHTSGVGATAGRGAHRSITRVATNYPSHTESSEEVVALKTIWGSPAGKKRLAPYLAALLPAHKTYVEPFAGSGAVLFTKEPADVEAVGDADPEIAHAYRTLKKLTSSQMEALGRMNWVGNEARFKRIYDRAPKDDLQKLYRFLYVSHFSYFKFRFRSFNPSAAGKVARTPARLKAFVPRLKHVHVHGGDYEPLLTKYDAKETVFFLDPPYVGYDARVGESTFDEERFFKALVRLKGKFLLTYGVRGKLPGLLKEAGFEIRRIKPPRHATSLRGVSGASTLTQLVVTNYTPSQKAEWIELWDGQLQLSDYDAKAPDHETTEETSLDVHKSDRFTNTCALLKNLDPEDERFVLGVVLEPEQVDAQGDIYSTQEIRQAAHRFMEEFRGLGWMHRIRVNGDVKVLESYLAPTDFSLGDVHVRKGTWLLAVRVISDDLWEQVRSGRLTGFSIGGSARRVPEEPKGAPPRGEVAG